MTAPDDGSPRSTWPVFIAAPLFFLTLWAFAPPDVRRIYLIVLALALAAGLTRLGRDD